jgi:hypothetical protein
MRSDQIPEKDTVFVLPTMLTRKTKMASSYEERMSFAVIELRESVWSEILHIAQCWKIDPQELIKASRRT